MRSGSSRKEPNYVFRDFGISPRDCLIAYDWPCSSRMK